MTGSPDRSAAARPRSEAIQARSCSPTFGERDGGGLVGHGQQPGRPVPVVAAVLPGGEPVRKVGPGHWCGRVVDLPCGATLASKCPVVRGAGATAADRAVPGGLAPRRRTGPGRRTGDVANSGRSPTVRADLEPARVDAEEAGEDPAEVETVIGQVDELVAGSRRARPDRCRSGYSAGALDSPAAGRRRSSAAAGSTTARSGGSTASGSGRRCS